MWSAATLSGTYLTEVSETERLLVKQCFEAAERVERTIGDGSLVAQLSRDEKEKRRDKQTSVDKLAAIWKEELRGYGPEFFSFDTVRYTRCPCP